MTALPELVTSDEELLLFDIEDGVEAAESTAAVLQLAEAAGDGPGAMTALTESPIGPGAAALTDPSRLPRAKPRNGSATSGKAKSLTATPRPGARVPVMHETVEMQDDCLHELEAVGLHGYVPLLKQARVVSLAFLKMHSIDELQDSLKRVGGKGFTFSAVDQRAWKALGLVAEPPQAALVPVPARSSPRPGELTLDEASHVAGRRPACCCSGCCC